MTFSDWLNQNLNERGWSQSEAARRSGLSASAIQQVVGGITRPGPRLCRGLARAFGVAPEEVFRLADLLPPPARADQRAEYRARPRPGSPAADLVALYEELTEDDQALILELVARLAYRVNPRVIGEETKE